MLGLLRNPASVASSLILTFKGVLCDQALCLPFHLGHPGPDHHRLRPGHADSYARPHPYRRSHSDGHAVADAYPRTHAYRYAGAHPYATADGYARTHSHCHAGADGYARTYPYRCASDFLAKI